MICCNQLTQIILSLHTCALLSLPFIYIALINTYILNTEAITPSRSKWYERGNPWHCLYPYTSTQHKPNVRLFWGLVWIYLTRKVRGKKNYAMVSKRKGEWVLRGLHCAPFCKNHLEYLLISEYPRHQTTQAFFRK